MNQRPGQGASRPNMRHAPIPPAGPRGAPGGTIERHSTPNADIISAREQQKAFRSAQRHSRYVSVLKFGLPLIAIGIVSVFVYWVTSQKPIPLPADIAKNDQTLKTDELIMQNPNLNGYSDGRAYEVIAKTATQKTAEPDVIYLNSLQAQITQENGNWIAFTSINGVFNQAVQAVYLNGNVDINSSNGLAIQTEKIQAEMEKGYLQSFTPVAVQSKGLRLQAGKLEAFENGERFHFSEGVKVLFDRALPGPPEKTRSQQGAQQ